MTNDNTKNKNEKTTTYGTAVEYQGSMYVKLDGSDLLTPVDTSLTLHDNDRVLIDINKHSATVTGNISNPSVSGVEIKEMEDSIMLVFKEGYYEGITTVNKDGVTVSHTNYGGYTKMSYDGFYLNDGESDVLKCTANGLVYTGTITASDIQSTDGTFEIDKNGNITGATFKTSKGGNFSIDENGDITAKGLAIEDNISSDTIICNDILNKAYPKTLTGNVKLYVDRNSGSDDNKCVDGAVFRTFQAAIDSIPKFLNGRSVSIYLNGDVTENITFTYFCCGKMYVYFNGHTLYGNINVYHTSCAIYFYGGNSTSDTTYGTIHAGTGINAASRSASVSVNHCKITVFYYFNLYAPDNQASGLATDKIGMGCQGGGYVYNSALKIINCNVGFRISSGCQLHTNTSSGVATRYGFQVATGGQLSFANNTQAGGVTAAINQASGGQVWIDKATFESGSASSSGNTAPTTTTTKVTTYTASSAQALQYAGTSSAFWRTDCKPKAGDWGYGAHTGWWFFGDDFENIANKNVTKVEITFTREKAGYYAATTHNFYVHNYESQPSTKSPSYTLSKIATASVGASTTHTITITDSTLIDLIKKAKGICTVPPSQSSTYYSVMSASMKVKFTYSG
jgi:hypothetical protein